MSIGILLIDISILKVSIYSVKCISKIHSGKNLICSSEISLTVMTMDLNPAPIKQIKS